MGTILVPLFAHYRPAAHLVHVAYVGGLRLYERTSIVVTTNLTFGEWPSVLAIRR